MDSNNNINDFKIASTESVEKLLDDEFISDNYFSFVFYLKDIIKKDGLTNNQYKLILEVCNSMIQDFNNIENDIKNNKECI